MICIVFLERARGVDVGDEGELNQTRGVFRVQLRRGSIICPTTVVVRF